MAPGNVGYGTWELPDVPYGAEPLNPLAPPRGRDIADGVLFLCSRLSSRVTAQTLVVDGGVLIKSRWGYSMEDVGGRSAE